MGISVVLLAYKEEENLKKLLPQIIENVEMCGEKYEIIIVDTAKPLDNTQLVCREFGAIYVNQEEPHFAGAFRTGIRKASMDKFLIMDSDGSHNPAYIPDIYRIFQEGADVAIGSRYVKGGKTEDSKISVYMSKVLNTAYRLFLGINAKDISTDYRMYHTEDLKKIRLICNNYDVLQEVLLELKLLKPNLVIKETPINFEKRIYGESKRNLIPFVISYLKTLLRLAFMSKNGTDRSLLQQLISYGVIGILAAGVDFGVFTFINNWGGGSISPVIANIAGTFTGFLVSFSCNTFLNFKKKDRLFRRFLSYFGICLLGMGISSMVIYLFEGYINLSILKILCIGGAAIFQFILNKLFTFRN